MSTDFKLKVDRITPLFCICIERLTNLMTISLDSSFSVIINYLYYLVLKQWLINPEAEINCRVGAMGVKGHRVVYGFVLCLK